MSAYAGRTNRPGLLPAVVFLCSNVLIVGRAVATDKNEPPPSGDAAADKANAEPDAAAGMDVWLRYASPGKYHEYLQPLVGQWTLTVRWWAGPDAPASVSHGTCSYEWIVGRRFLLQKTSGTFGGTASEGVGILGYDNFRGRYSLTWLDSLSTAVMISWGRCDLHGKIFTFFGEYDDVESGERIRSRSVLKIISDDEHVFESFNRGADGKEFKSLQISYKRQ